MGPDDLPPYVSSADEEPPAGVSFSYGREWNPGERGHLSLQAVLRQLLRVGAII